MVSSRLPQLRGGLPSTPNLSTSSSTSILLYFTTCAALLVCLTIGVTCSDPELKNSDNTLNMAKNEETTYPRKDDYVDLMRTEGTIVEDDVDEYTKSQLDGFYYFREVQQHLINKDFPDWKLAEIERELVEIWNNADDETQIEYVNDAVTELACNDNQPEMTDSESGSCSKDRNAPERPLSAFFWWSLDERDKVKALHPQYREGDIATELGKRWLAADSETKAKYEAIEADDNARYQREMTEYKEISKGNKQLPQHQINLKMRAYGFFMDDCIQELKTENPAADIVFHEFSEKCNLKWENMSDEEKNRYYKMVGIDQNNYENPLKNEGVTAGKAKKREYNKGPNAPKRPFSAFFWWSSDERGKVRELHPEYSEEDITKELDHRWIAADSETKSKYETIAAEDDARYKREMIEYKKTWKTDEVSIHVPAIIIRNHRRKDAEKEDDKTDDN